VPAVSRGINPGEYDYMRKASANTSLELWAFGNPPQYLGQLGLLFTCFNGQAKQVYRNDGF